MVRKISPHLTVYKFPITAISSITNRVTGVYLTSLYISFGVSILLKKDPLKIYNNLDKYPKKIVDYSISFPVFYHTLGGIRHLVWDKYPKFINNNIAKKTSFLIYGTGIFSTFIFNEFLKDKI